MSPSIDWELLKATALAARGRAYAPYSRFQVGAAVLTESGEIFSGCNVENASFGITICAERVTLSSAVAAGHLRFRALAVCAHPLASPCGSCRQFIVEFGEAIQVLSFDAEATQLEKRWTSAELLPDLFRLRESR
ncbi:MAG: cytidine deaminase [Planctomycetota bacterium]